MNTQAEPAHIEGVLVTRLKKVVNPRGHLMEVQRADDSHYSGFGQAYVTMTNPGVVKAWYRHHKQIDQIALIKGELLLVLFDTRPESATCNALTEIRIQEDEPQLIRIPPGVWHGFQAVGSDPAFLLHLNSIPFDFENTDEDRISDDDPLIPYSWSR